MLDHDDLRLIAALQCDGRLTVDRAATVLGLSQRVAQRRLRALLGGGVVRVVAVRRRAESVGATMLRIRVLRGKIDAVAAALAAREDIPFIDISQGGDEISAAMLSDPGQRNSLVFRQLPATKAVTTVHAETVMHVFAEATDWRLDALRAAERAELEVPQGNPADRELDQLDDAILTALERDGRLSAAAIAAQVRHPESTVRRRLAGLRADGRFVMLTSVDPRRLGLRIDANITMQVAPARLDRAGTTLARHPAVHGALATTGGFNLHVAVWLRDLEDLYRFVTGEIAELGVDRVETFLVGHALKRPGR